MTCMPIHIWTWTHTQTHIHQSTANKTPKYKYTFLWSKGEVKILEIISNLKCQWRKYKQTNKNCTIYPHKNKNLKEKIKKNNKNNKMPWYLTTET